MEARQATPEMFRQIRLLRDLDEHTREVIAEKARLVAFDRDETIIRQNDPGQSVYFIYSGDVKVVHYTQNGKAVTFRVMHAGDVFGELAAIDAQPRSSSVMAQSCCRLLVIPSDTFLQLATTLPGLAAALMTYLTSLVRSLSERVQDAQYPARCRILKELCLMTERDGRPVGDGSVLIEPAPSQHELASRLSTNRETISREFTNLQRQGILAKISKHHKIVVLQPDTLFETRDELFRQQGDTS